MGHLRQHSFTGSTDHNFGGLSNNYLLKLNSSGTGITDSQIYDNGTNVGINQTSLSAKLDIKTNRADGGGYAFRLATSGDTELMAIRDDGYSQFDKGGIGSIFGNQSSSYLQHIANRLEQFSNAATYTGFHANRDGSGISLRATSANDISLIESTGTMTFSTNWDNNFNGIGTLAMLINGDNQYVGIGMPTNLTIPGAKLSVRGSGNTGDGRAFLVENSDGTNMMTINNAGLSMFGTTSTASTFGGVVGAIHAELTVTDPAIYASAQAVTTTYNPTANASGYIRNLSTNIIKYGIYNAPYIAGNTSNVRNDSSAGTVTDALGYDSVAFSNGSGTTTNLFAYQGNSQAQDGATITNLGGLKVTFGSTQAGTTVTNMYGLLVTTPQNTGGAVTNTYGVHLQTNTLGSSGNWGIYQDGTSVNNYFGGNTAIGTTTTSGGKFTIKGTGNTNSGITQKWIDSDNIQLATLSDDGIFTISAKSDYVDSDMSGGLRVNYDWEGTNGSTNHVIAIDANLAGSNYGAQTTTPIRGYFYGINTNTGMGIQGRAYLDNASMGASGVQGYVTGNNFNKCIGVESYILMQGAGSSDIYGGKFEAGITVDPSQTVYGIHSTAQRNTAGNGTFIGGYFKAQNGASNYSIVTDGGNAGINTTTPTDMLHVNGVTGSTQFRLEQSHTPTSSGSTSGNIGSVAWDNNYFYMKTNLGWGRVAWDYNF